MKTMKKVILGAIASMVSLSAFPVGQAVQAQESNEDVTELTFWYANTGAIADNNEELTQLFNDTVGAELGIQVAAEFQGSYSDLESKLTASFIADEAPHVTVMEISSTGVFADSGVIQPIDDVIAEEDLADFYPGLMENSYIDDALYAVPYLRSNPIFYYNRTLFEEAGIDPDIELTTYEDIVEISDELAEIGVNSLGFNAFAWNYNPQKSFDSEPGTLEQEVGHVYDAQNLADITSFFKDAAENHNFAYFSGGNASEDRELAVLNQTAAIWQGSTGSLQNYLSVAEENGFEIGTMPTPTVNGYQSVNGGGANVAMISDLEDAEREAAAEFINFLIAPEQVLTSHLNTGYLVTRESLEGHEEIVAYHEEFPAYQTAAEQVEYTFGAPMAEGYGQTIGIIMAAFEDVMATDEDPLAIYEPAVEESVELLEAE